MLLLFVIIIVLVLWLFFPRESFITEFNASSIPQNPIGTIYEQETSRIDSLFETLLPNVTTLPDYKNVFQKSSTYIRFPLNDLFKRTVLEASKRILTSTDYYKKSKLQIIRDVYNLYWTDVGGDRHYIFNIYLNDTVKAFTRKMKAYIVIRYISSYTDDNGNFINTQIDDKNISIKYIATDNPLSYLSSSPNTQPILYDDKSANYYQIKNKLHLTEPFPTSQNDMIITEAMQNKFEQYLTRKQTEDREKKGICYNSTAVGAVKKEDCIDAGGIWDYRPSDSNECPYYKANENYPNNFGKLNGDKCELPRNMQLIGNRNYSYDPKYAPLCYNCVSDKIGNGSLGFCCEKQNNKTLYPFLITPDYAFINDKSQRQKYKAELALKSLNVE